MMYGIWNNWRKEFQFGIREPSEEMARKALYKKIGKDSYKWRFEVRRIPTYHVIIFDNAFYWCGRRLGFRTLPEKAKKYNSFKDAADMLAKLLDEDDEDIRNVWKDWYTIEKYTSEGKLVEIYKLKIDTGEGMIRWQSHCC
jgi:hypothetical protein